MNDTNQTNDSRTLLAWIGDQSRALGAALVPWRAAFTGDARHAQQLLAAAGFAFVFTFSVTVVKSVASALFLSRFGSTPLPWIYIGSAAIVTLVSFALVRPLASFGPASVLHRVSEVAGVLLLILAGLANTGSAPVYGTLYTFSEAYATTLSVVLWATLGEAFGPREQRSAFAFVSAVSMAGVLIGGVATRAVPAIVPQPIALGLCAIALVLAPRWLVQLIGSSGGRAPERDFRQGLRYLRSDAYPRFVFAFVFLVAVLSAGTDYLFRQRATEALGEAGLTRLFGDLNAAVGIFALLFQLFITPRLLGRIGLFAFLGLVPLSIIALNVLALLWPGSIAAWFVLKTLEMAGAFALIPAGAQLLYNPMPKAARASVRATIDGAGKRFGAALGGVLLLGLGATYGVPDLLPLYLALTIVVLLPLLRRQYLTELSETISGASPRERELAMLIATDSTTRRALEDALKTGDKHQVDVAIETLSKDPHFDFTRFVPGLLAHNAATVRMQGAALALLRPHPSFADALVANLTHQDAYVRAAAARALGVVSPELARQKLEKALDDESDPALRAGAIAAFWLSKSKRDIAAASLRQLLNRMNVLDLPMRVELARLIGSLGRSPYSARLEPLLRDPSPAVRKAASRAAFDARDPTLIAALLAALSDRETSAAVRETLALFGDDAVPRIWALLDDRQAPLKLRTKLPRVLRSIGTPFAAEAFLYSNPQDDPQLQNQLISELFAMKREHPELVLDKARTDEAIVRRLQVFAYFLPLVPPLRDDARFRLLCRATTERVAQTLEGILKLLTLHRAGTQLMAAHSGLRSANARDRDNALELLDEALKGDPLHDDVLKTLEGVRRVRDEKLSAAEVASKLARSQDAVLRAIARHSMERIGLEAGVPLFSTIAQMLVQQTSKDKGDDMASDMVERILLLEGVTMFAGAEIDDIAAVAQICQERKVDAGVAVYEEGALGEEMFVVSKGGVSIERAGRQIMTFSAGESFGHVSVLDRGPRPATAKAMERGVELLVIDRQHFMDLVTDRPELLHGLFRVLTRRVRDLLEAGDV
ncbi:MAG: HEAT repeat domain-containing protein [Deltaproteobacteria bacterium]|nr:HEAT repeat domain-containing protein [Deltaproteobacteria bacterium]